MNEDIKRKIEQSLKTFAQGNLTQNAIVLFQTLGYATDRQAPLAKPTYANFKESFVHADSRFNEEKAQTKEWKHVDLLFQLTKDEVSRNTSLFDTTRVDRTIIEAYLFFVVELAGGEYSRTSLSHITREVNRLFPMPVLILFKHGGSLTLSVIDRRLHKRDEAKDVLEKVTLIKDINIHSPHRAHIEILVDLSLPELTRKHAPTNFVELHAAWRATLNISELNKKFYKKIAAWYFWAVKSVEFPMAPNVKDEKVNSSVNVIRMLTRLIFVWFLKEKNLVPDDLFDERKLARLLKSFNGSDAKKSDYYKAILQNLFFGTLNQKMNTKKEPENRRFATDDRDQWGRVDDYNITNLYRYKEAFQNPDEALKVFSTIPFLNGGLFDCLDKPDDNDKRKVIRIDGFSRVAKNQPTVPSILFFGGAKDELEIDLSDIYDDKKHKRDKVKGLIHILNDYKFTIAENTPVEEEIALDPELLGRIFENLLAEYDPETGTTARKATGSFYTPREIVNYMVDESLIAYLKTKLQDSVTASEAKQSDSTEREIASSLGDAPRNDVEPRLRSLVAYNDEKPKFTPEETDFLIDAIHTMKVLDPACGSGAFPMGVLLKVVHILHKLDPENGKWKQKQIDVAEQIPDSSIRQETLESIDEAFSEENNFADYGRKLYLIENCIYGVDIQPIATQIAKLRFFVSLLVDQRGSDRKENRGVISLPNLETKFVAANTLIGLGGQDVLKPDEFHKLEDRLKKVRHDYFNAKTRRDKMKYMAEDKKLREAIADSLRHAGMQKSAVDMLAHWDPYDQNVAAGFFSADWMLGGTNGFDVVIGNPPYSLVGSDRKDEQEYYRKNYSLTKYKINTYLLFLEKGLNLLTKGCSILSFIIPKSLVFNTYFADTRKVLLTRYLIFRVVELRQRVFESGEVGDNILFFAGNGSNVGGNLLKYLAAKEVYPETELLEHFESTQRELAALVDPKFSKRGATISVPVESLEDICIISNGLNPGNVRHLLLSKKKETNNHKKLVLGRDVQRFCLEWSGTWVNYDPTLKDRISPNQTRTKRGMTPQQKVDFALRDPSIYAPNKIIVRKTADRIIACHDPDGYHYDALSYGIRPRSSGISLKYLLGLLNSSVVEHFHAGLSQNKDKVFAKVLSENLKKLQIRRIDSSNPNDKNLHDSIVRLVDQILAAKKKNPEADTSVLENEIDRIVYELYGLTAEEIGIVEGKR